jgi:hypothetical protein
MCAPIAATAAGWPTVADGTVLVILFLGVGEHVNNFEEGDAEPPELRSSQRTPLARNVSSLDSNNGCTVRALTSGSNSAHV